MRYIDAEKIEYHEVFEGHEFVRVAYGDDIDELPSADVVEVVRCKDCRHYSADGWGYGNCYRSSVEYLRMADNGYCSFGERIEDDKGRSD